jgi:hypothetical protein
MISHQQIFLATAVFLETRTRSRARYFVRARARVARESLFFLLSLRARAGPGSSAFVGSRRSGAVGGGGGWASLLAALHHTTWDDLILMVAKVTGNKS